MYRHQNVGHNHNIKTANRSYENVAQFKYFGKRVTNQNLIQEEIKRRMNSGIACYQFLLSKNVNIRLYKSTILPVVLYGCETWPLTLREEQILKVFKNRALTRIFGPKRDEVIGGWRKLHNEELHNLCSTPNTI
jgi:hypothetical protein